MADIAVPTIATVTPASGDTVLGVQGGRVRRFAVGDVRGFTLLAPSSGADDTAAINAALASGAALVVGKQGQAYRISAPLLIQSGQTLDMTGCSVTLLPGSDCNMLRNANHAGPSRDNDIRVIGGTWDRGANGGIGNVAHSIFLRNVDGVSIERVTYTSTGGKYGVALGGVTRARVADIVATAASDTVHITGPASDVVIERVHTATGGDDVVALTTTDYVAYDDVRGTIERVTIRDVKGSNGTRVVLVAGSASGAADGFDVKDITIDCVTQAGSGASVYLGHPFAVSELIDNVRIARASGGMINLRAVNIGRVLVEACSSPSGSPLVVVSPEGGQTVNDVASLVVSRCKKNAAGALVQAVSSISTIKALVVESCDVSSGSLLLLAASSVDQVSVRDTRFSGSVVCVEASGGSVGQLTFDQFFGNLGATRHVVVLSGAASASRIAFIDCSVSAADTSSGILVNAASTATVGKVNVRGGTFTGIGRVLELANGSSGTCYVSVAQANFSGCNRLAQVGGATLNFAFNDVLMSGMVNQPLRIYGGGSLVIRGSGWNGYAASAAVRAATESVRVISPDFPVDLSIVAKNNGDCANNTNASLSCGTGVCVSNGANWKNTYSGLIY